MFTTLVGMCTIDAMMMHKHKHFNKRPKEPKTTTLLFAAILAKQLLDNKWDDCDSNASNATPP